MGLILGDGILLLLIVGGIVFAVTRKSVQKDIDELKMAEQLRRQHDIEARDDQRRFQNGVELVCLGCCDSTDATKSLRFQGPLEDSGCPKCHSSSLVMTIDEYNRRANKELTKTR